jgi:glycosyltransferase involved in cell wall biosynthesis
MVLDQKKKTLVSELGLKDRVVFAGFCNNVIGEIAKARLFLFTSNYEGMPNALMEAMSVGLPCISVDCDGGAAKYLIKDSINGILINKNDIDALEKQMRRLLDDELFSQRLADNARRINEDLSPDNIYSKWEEVIRAVSKRNLK